MRAMQFMVVVGLAWVVTASVLITGCETTETTDNVITVTPAESYVSSTQSVVTLKASMTGTNLAMVLPLEWSVSDTSLGIIKAVAGDTAVYEATLKHGHNIIYVSDTGDSEGVAAVIMQ